MTGESDVSIMAVHDVSCWHLSMNRSASVGAVRQHHTPRELGGASPTGAPGTRQTDFGTDYGIYRRLWRGSSSSVVPGTPQNTGLVSHLQTREPMWKSRFAEKFKHSVEVKQNKAKQEFGCTGVSKRNNLTLLASPPRKVAQLRAKLDGLWFLPQGEGAVNGWFF